MFKHLFIAAVAATGTVYAQDQLISTGVATTMTEEDAMAIIGEFAQFMEELTSALESVNDNASAEAAADRINNLKLVAGDLQLKLNSIQTMAPAIQQKLLPIVLGIVMEHGQRVSNVVDTITANNYYGSQALRECILELQAN